MVYELYLNKAIRDKKAFSGDEPYIVHTFTCPYRECDMYEPWSWKFKWEQNTISSFKSGHSGGDAKGHNYVQGAA